MKPILIFAIIFLTTFPVFAQNPVSRAKMTVEMATQVKQLDDFIDRFNGTVLPDGQKAAELPNLSRKECLKLLINQEHERWKTPDYVAKVGRFLNVVCADAAPIKLDKYSDKFYCIANCEVEYADSPNEIELLFSRKVEKNVHNWVLAGASASFLEIGLDAGDRNAVLPNAHETNFLSFTNAIHQGKSVFSFTENEFKYDPLSAFIFAIDRRMLKMKECSNVILYLTEVKGWVVKVETFSRPTSHSGWLISDLIELSTPSENDTRKKILSSSHPE